MRTHARRLRLLALTTLSLALLAGFTVDAASGTSPGAIAAKKKKKCKHLKEKRGCTLKSFQYDGKGENSINSSPETWNVDVEARVTCPGKGTHAESMNGDLSSAISPMPRVGQKRKVDVRGVIIGSNGDDEFPAEFKGTARFKSAKKASLTGTLTRKQINDGPVEPPLCSGKVKVKLKRTA